MEKDEKRIADVQTLLGEMEKALSEANEKLKARSHKNPDPEKAKEQQQKDSAKRSKYFTFMLYPDCEEHCRILEYIKTHEHITKYVYILHDRDVWLDDDEDDDEENDIEFNPKGKNGEPKKPHWHVLLKTKMSTVPKSIAKFYGLICAFKCNNPINYLSYMLHDTPQSKQKAQYKYEDLQGTAELKQLIATKMQILYNLEKMLDMMEDAPTFVEIMTKVRQTESKSEWESFAEFALRYGNFAVGLTNQEIRRKADRDFDSATLHAIKRSMKNEQRKAFAEEYGRIVERYNGKNSADWSDSDFLRGAYLMASGASSELYCNTAFDDVGDLLK